MTYIAPFASIHLILISLCVAAASESESIGSPNANGDLENVVSNDDGEEEETDGGLVQLKEQLRCAVQHHNSTNTEEKLLQALKDLEEHVSRDYRCAYDSQLAETLEHLQRNSSEEVYHLVRSIQQSFPCGEKGKFTFVIPPYI